jgi:aspartyl-tRNA(Asn)/glutamyl-tRNA(Gln) amidotransferase subunit C
MSVTINDVEHVATLARLEFTEDEKQKLTHQLNEILAYMEKLNQLDTENVDPLSHMVEQTSVMRDDEVRPSLSQEEVLKNAPEKTARHFKVPRVIAER